MVKYCISKYPMGSWKGQRSDGRFMDGWLYQNLNLLAEKIVDDMTFLAIIYSSTLEVGTGKSVLATQIGEAWSEIIKQKHNIDIPFTVDNIVWRPKELMEKAFKVPKYSCLLLDEWEDTHYWSELGVSLRQFFRKCRQLNLFIICIIPNWFQLPIDYAISRSVFAIDVRFNNKLDRGNFAFYNFPSKRILYVAGKRGHNYRVIKPTFMGRFGDGYGVDEEEYKKRKFEDMLKYDKENPVKKTKAEIEWDMKVKFFKCFNKKFPDYTNIATAELFDVSDTSVSRWKKGDLEFLDPTQHNYNTLLTDKEKKEIVVDEATLIQSEKEKEDYIEEPEEPIINDEVSQL